MEIRIEIRFIFADSGLALNPEIAASGDLSAGPVPRAWFQAERRFVEKSGDVINRPLIKKLFGRQAIFRLVQILFAASAMAERRFILTRSDDFISRPAARQ
jgi:hypothetical protein